MVCRRRCYRPQNAAREERTYINKQVLPQAPSPTMTSFRRISAMVSDGYLGLKTGERVDVGVDEARDGLPLIIAAGRKETSEGKR